MTDTKPEALRLADELVCASREDAPVHIAADELRRLHEENAELVEALKGLMEWQVKNVDTWHNSAYDHAAKIIAKAEVTK
jgi:hypothetical protein